MQRFPTRTTNPIESRIPEADFGLTPELRRQIQIIRELQLETNSADINAAYARLPIIPRPARTRLTLQECLAGMSPRERNQAIANLISRRQNYNISNHNR